MRVSFSLIAVLLFLTIVGGCYYDKEELLYPGSGKVDCTTASAKFSTDVKPIMQNKCATAGCHNTAGAAGGVILETFAQISGKAARINQRCVVEKTMPPAAPLTPSEIASLKCWIDSGAPNN
jgi:uncharacterized membrane protein